MDKETQTMNNKPSQHATSGPDSAKPATTVELSPRDIETQNEITRLEAKKYTINLRQKKIINENKERILASKRSVLHVQQHDISYNRTVERAQSELPKSSRIFSKIIHIKLIDDISDFIGNIIARPNVILFGSISAFLITLITYMVSKYIGYAMSGSETIAAFIIGFIIGIIHDYLRLLFTGKKY